MYKVAVTGATGFVGRFVSEYLESKGYQVFRFGRKNSKDIINWDIALDKYDKPIAIDCVVHCAALVDDWASYQESYSVNVLGTKNVLQSFTGVSKFIYISSASVYDSFCKQVVISEDQCLGGRLLNNYSRTKLLGEKEVEKSNILSRVILRPHIIYGPNDTTIAPRILGAIKFGHLPIPGNGKNRISFTHVENLAQAVLKAIVLSENSISIYNITDEESVALSESLKDFKNLNGLNFKEIYIPKNICMTIGSFLEFFYKLFSIHKSPMLSRYIVDQMSSDHIFDISKAQKYLDYKPTRGIKNDFLIR